MFTFVIISKDGRQIFSHSEPTYKALVAWGRGSDQDVSTDAHHWQIRDPKGNIINMMTISGRKLII